MHTKNVRKESFVQACYAGQFMGVVMKYDMKEVYFVDFAIGMINGVF
jgi:hypothetical protein